VSYVILTDPVFKNNSFPGLLHATLYRCMHGTRFCGRRTHIRIGFLFVTTLLHDGLIGKVSGIRRMLVLKVIEAYAFTKQ
jgi:hypothetical protein